MSVGNSLRNLWRFLKVRVINRSEIRKVLNEINVNEKEQNFILEEFVNEVHLQDRLLERLKLFTVGDAKDLVAWIYKEYDALFDVPGVVDVTVESGQLCIFTDNIFIRSSSLKQYTMGKYRIEIDMNGDTSDDVKIFSEEGGKSVSGYIHPHIHGSGVCCFGNIGDGVGKLVRSKQYAILVQLLFEYLQSYNDGNPYKQLHYWG